MNQLTETNTPTEKQIIAQNIAFFRKKLNITQTELAKKLQYSNKNISKWEKGETTPDIFTLKKLAIIFGVSLDTLVNPMTDENKNALKTKTVIPVKWKLYMLALVISIIFLSACIIFYILKSINFTEFPLFHIFIYILPIIDLVVFVFLCFIKHKADIISLSLLGWLTALCFHISFWGNKDIAYIYVIALAYQILTLFLTKLINSGKIIKLNKIIISKLKNKAD